MIKKIGKALFSNYTNGVKYLAYSQPNAKSLLALGKIKHQNPILKLFDELGVAKVSMKQLDNWA